MYCMKCGGPIEMQPVPSLDRKVEDGNEIQLEYGFKCLQCKRVWRWVEYFRMTSAWWEEVE